MQIQIIGCGVMGEIFLKAFLDFGIKKEEIFVEDSDQNRLKQVKEKYDITTGINTEADFVLLATKPQDFSDNDFIKFIQSPIICSIMAGISFQKIEEKMETKNIIRLMPNLALSARRGVVGYIDQGIISEEKKQILIDILSQIGKVIMLKNEEQIDQITALSGSGPAYFYYLAEIFQNQAVDFGFSQEDATTIANQILVGAGAVLDNGKLTVSDLKRAITSKGGTTQAALDELQKGGIVELVQKGIQASYNRAKALEKTD